jgi:hypothetical protein
MRRAVAVALNCSEFPIGCGDNLPSLCHFDVERTTASLAADVAPVECETGIGTDVLVAGGDDLLSLLFEDLVDDYRALFLLKSYESKIIATSSPEIDIPDV